MSVHMSHIGIGVTDVERSRAFYENVFGFEFDTEIVAEGPYVAQLMRLPNPCRVRAVLMKLKKHLQRKKLQSNLLL